MDPKPKIDELPAKDDKDGQKEEVADKAEPPAADKDGQKEEVVETSEQPEQMLPSPEEPSADYQLQSEAESSEGQLSGVGDGMASKETELETDIRLASEDEQDVRLAS